MTPVECGEYKTESNKVSTFTFKTEQFIYTDIFLVGYDEGGRLDYRRHTTLNSIEGQSQGTIVVGKGEEKPFEDTGLKVKGT